MAIVNLETARSCAEILNESMTKLGYGEGTKIDTSSLETIEAGMKAIGALPREMLNQLLNQVNIVLIYRNYATMFTSSKNPTRRFWRDAVNYGGGEADIYQEILEPVEGVVGIWARDYADGDEDGTLALNNAKYHFGYHGAKVQKKFHTTTTRFDIALSLSELEISKIFTPEGFAGYMSAKIANIQYSAEIQLLNAVIENVRAMVQNRALKFREPINVNNTNGVTEMVEDIQTITDGMKMPSTEFNEAGILTMSDPEDLYLLTTPQFMNRIRVRGAANAFNINEYMFKNNVITLPAGTDFGRDEAGNTVHAVLVDRRAIVMAIRYWSMRPFIPTGSDFQNYFFKCEFIHGYNEFFNAIAFTGEPIDDFFNGEGAYLTLYSDDLMNNGFVFDRFNIVGRRVYTSSLNVQYYENVQSFSFDVDVQQTESGSSSFVFSKNGQDIINRIITQGDSQTQFSYDVPVAENGAVYVIST